MAAKWKYFFSPVVRGKSGLFTKRTVKSVAKRIYISGFLKYKPPERGTGLHGDNVEVTMSSEAEQSVDRLVGDRFWPGLLKGRHGNYKIQSMA